MSGIPAAVNGDDREARWLARIVQHRKVILVGAAVLTAGAVWSATRVSFSYNMLKLQAHGVESVAWEQRILARAGRSGFAALTTASGLEELRTSRRASAPCGRCPRSRAR